MQKISKFLPFTSQKFKAEGFQQTAHVLSTIRFGHTDVKFPDFTEIRRPSNKSPNSKGNNTVSTRKNFTYLVAGLGVLGGYYSTKTIVRQLVGSMSASADVLALAQIEINLNDIPEGSHVTFKWRGKPLFIKHRTPADIERARAVPLSELRDPERDEDRVKKAEFLVVIGVCTHLGCVPIPNAGDFGGYYCPCHGSHFDGAGRARKGPAPSNLVVPQYEFPDENTIRVG